ncbi:hypothetical protein CAPTEDRAFT_113755, partial [Capitella teleta]
SGQCSRYPCENGGQCSRTSSTPYYACYCKVGWRGVNCSEGKHTFQNKKPCQNGGWCIQKGVDFVCRCRLGYGGDRCQFSECWMLQLPD